MELWLSILDFCRAWRRELIRYGVVLLLCVSALCTEKWGAAGLMLAAGFVMYACDLWGEPWRKRGESLTKRKNT
ncbi:MAG TPA: hypothetical protein VD994_19665 [Prosthecobacter sp.]|nr:hypothetical protein [Prosthecobacter sp.]